MGEEDYIKELARRFSRFEHEFLNFAAVENKLSKRPDLHAFIMLDILRTSDRDMISGAEHDEIWLSVSTAGLHKDATDDQIRDLVRCGVRYHEGLDSLCMFV